MLKKFTAALFFLSFALAFLPQATLAVGITNPASVTSSSFEDFTIPFGDSSTTAEIPDTYYQARVATILEQGQEMVDGQLQEHQKVELVILDGDAKGQHIVVDHGGTFAIQEYQKVKVGDVVVLDKPAGQEATDQPAYYYIADKYRVNDLIILALVFFALAIYFGRWRGLTSIVGMLFSIFIIFYFIIPHIIAGGNALAYSVSGSFIIIIFSLYLSHGFNQRTTIALVSTLLSLAVAVGVDYIFVHVAQLSGTGTEEAFFLQMNTLTIDLTGLLLGGILIGVLGVLDDVTTGQAAAVEEIHHANPRLTFSELYRRGISVGREHIASLINTLVLAYVGASFPLLLLYSSEKLQPLWVTLNSNFISEEIVRTLVGSAILVIAVPLTTLLAALFYSLHSSSNE